MAKAVQRFTMHTERVTPDRCESAEDGAQVTLKTASGDRIKSPCPRRLLILINMAVALINTNTMQFIAEVSAQRVAAAK